MSSSGRRVAPVVILLAAGLLSGVAGCGLVVGSGDYVVGSVDSGGSTGNPDSSTSAAPPPPVDGGAPPPDAAPDAPGTVGPMRSGHHHRRWSAQRMRGRWHPRSGRPSHKRRCFPATRQRVRPRRDMRSAVLRGSDLGLHHRRLPGHSLLEQVPRRHHVVRRLLRLSGQSHRDARPNARLRTCDGRRVVQQRGRHELLREWRRHRLELRRARGYLPRVQRVRLRRPRGHRGRLRGPLQLRNPSTGDNHARAHRRSTSVPRRTTTNIGIGRNCPAGSTCTTSNGKTDCFDTMPSCTTPGATCTGGDLTTCQTFTSGNQSYTGNCSVAGLACDTSTSSTAHARRRVRELGLQRDLRRQQPSALHRRRPVHLRLLHARPICHVRQ